jgi:hypothetical protein
MTNEAESTDTPEVETPPPVVERPAAAPPPPARPVLRRPFYESPVARAGLGLIAAVLIFAGGFAAGHWVFDRHDHDDDRRRPDFSVRAERFLEGLRGERDGNRGRNAPQTREAPELQQLLSLFELLLNNRGSGSSSRSLSPGSNPDDLQRRVQQLEQQLRQLQQQLRVTPTPAAP